MQTKVDTQQLAVFGNYEDTLSIQSPTRENPVAFLSFPDDRDSELVTLIIEKIETFMNYTSDEVIELLITYNRLGIQYGKLKSQLDYMKENGATDSQKKVMVGLLDQANIDKNLLFTQIKAVIQNVFPKVKQGGE